MDIDNIYWNGQFCKYWQNHLRIKAWLQTIAYTHHWYHPFFGAEQVLHGVEPTHWHSSYHNANKTGAGCEPISSTCKRKRKQLQRQCLHNHGHSSQGLKQRNDSFINKDAGTASAEFEFEMSDELLAFFKQTAEHRKEQALIKASQTSAIDNDDCFLDLESGRGRATKLAPSQQKSTVRRDEMQLLYGVGAAMIQGMETAMQLTFDRNTDRFKPRPWPALPLNIQFSKSSNEQCT